MKNLLFIDAMIFVIAAVAAFLRGNFMLIIEIIGYIGLILIVAAAILMGSFLSGDKIRANYNPEKEELKQKNRLSENLFFVGLLNIATSICLQNRIRNLPYALRSAT